MASEPPQDDAVTSEPVSSTEQKVFTLFVLLKIKSQQAVVKCAVSRNTNTLLLHERSGLMQLTSLASRE